MKWLRRISFFSLPFTILCLLLLQFVFSNELAGSSQRMKLIDKEIDIIKKENSLLEQQAAVGKSITTVAKKAGELGLIKQALYVTIPLAESVALRTP